MWGTEIPGGRTSCAPLLFALRPKEDILVEICHLEVTWNTWGQQDKSRAVSNPEPIHMSEKSPTLPCGQPLGAREGKRAERALYVKLT